MATVGEQLRSARLAKNLTIEEIAEKTKIRGHFIHCLEDQDLDKLPSKFAAQSFLRQYAFLLELDAEQLLRDASPTLPGLDEPPEPVEKSGQHTSSMFFVRKAAHATRAAIRRNAVSIGKIVIAFGLIVSGSTFWFLLSDSGKPGSRTGSAAAPASRATRSGLEAIASAPGAGGPTDAGSQAREARSPVDRAASSREQGSPANRPSRTVLESRSGAASPIEVEIEATERVWVRWLIDGGEDGEIFVNAGARHRIEADAEILATIGNAGAANLILSGEAQSAIGEPGQVRHIRITRSGWTRIPPGTF